MAKTGPYWRVISISDELSVYYQGLVAFESEADVELYQSLLCYFLNPVHLVMWHSSKYSIHKTPVPSAVTTTNFREKLGLLVTMNHIAFLVCVCVCVASPRATTKRVKSLMARFQDCRRWPVEFYVIKGDEFFSTDRHRSL